MRKIVKRPLARQDLKQIWRYSFKEWGEAQADTYFADIEAGILKLQEHPHLGKSREDLRAGYYALRVRGACDLLHAHPLLDPHCPRAPCTAMWGSRRSFCRHGDDLAVGAAPSRDRGPAGAVPTERSHRAEGRAPTEPAGCRGSADDVLDALGGEDALGPGEQGVGVGLLDAARIVVRDLAELEAQQAQQDQGLALLAALLRRCCALCALLADLPRGLPGGRAGNRCSWLLPLLVLVS